MRAYRMTDWGERPISTTVPVPSPGPGEVLVRVAGCGLCRSDLTMRRMPQVVGENLGWRMAFTLGHETAGRIAGLGAGIDGLTVGEAVALVSPTSCGSCNACLRGRDSMCRHGQTGRGYGRDGGLADYVLVPGSRGVLPLGDLDPRSAGVLTDAGATAYHAVRRILPIAGDVVVIGVGGLGSFAVQFLRVLSGARVSAVDTSADRRALAASAGATVFADLSGVPDADAVLDFVGTDETIAAGIALLRPGGSFGLIGSAGGRLAKPWFGTLPRDGTVFTFQGSSIADAAEVIALARGGSIRNDVTPFAFDEVDAAYARLAAGTLAGRAVIVLD